MNIKQIQEKLNPGVYISNKNEIIQDQHEWSDGDECKNVDFSNYNFWITTDNGAKPKGFNSLEEIPDDYMN
mgnify:CR=1 FL=1